MRGSQFLLHVVDAHCGIIPAHAGLTECIYRRRARLWDHPRACGAHAVDVEILEAVEGSSPRMRGSLYAS